MREESVLLFLYINQEYEAYSNLQILEDFFSLHNKLSKY